jgi:CRP/FNR family transcriptional regulator, cyclic AMP receptor protein
VTAPAALREPCRWAAWQTFHFCGRWARLLRQLESRCGFVRYEANELIIDYDDLSDDVYFVLTGKVRILYRAGTGKEVILGELGRGEFFGELAAIDGQPRSANVTALHRSELCRMPGAVFNRARGRAGEFNRCLLKVLSSRIRSLNARLAEQAFLQVKYRLFAELIRLSAPRPEAARRARSPRRRSTTTSPAASAPAARSCRASCRRSKRRG